MKFWKVVTAVFTLVFSICSNAATISYQFTGVLDNITDEFSHLTGQFSAGDTFLGGFTYITDAPEGASTIDDSTVAIYRAITEYYVNINGYIFEGDSSPSHLQVWDDRVVGSSVVDAFTVNSPLDYTPPISGMGPGQVVAGSNLNLFDFTHTASLQGIQVPSEINLSDYGAVIFRALQLNTDTGESFHLTGVVTALNPVPVPAAVWLFSSGLIGLIGLIGFSRKRK